MSAEAQTHSIGKVLVAGVLSLCAMLQDAPKDGQSKEAFISAGAAALTPRQIGLTSPQMLRLWGIVGEVSFLTSISSKNFLQSRAACITESTFAAERSQKSQLPDMEIIGMHRELVIQNTFVKFVHPQVGQTTRPAKTTALRRTAAIGFLATWPVIGAC